ncbi:MAG: TolC family protein [Bacteroidales bacterium]|nr:TolC family protein [Bacteroidales bacterium]
MDKYKYFGFWLILLLIFLNFKQVSAQEALTLEKAIEIAGMNSPDLQRSLFSLNRFQETLKAERASLKSQFSLSVNPITYDNSRQFDNRFSEWYTNENIQSGATFRVDQPILWTDGTLSLVNTFGWQKNISDAQGYLDENTAFTNNLYLSLNQPLFTYNRTKLELKTIELDLENANINYALQKLSLEKNVTQFFYNVYLARMSLDIAEEELSNTQKSYEIIKNKVNAGLEAMEELYQAELNLATSESTLQNRQVELDNAKDAFKKFLGMDLYTDIVVLAIIINDSVQVDLEKAVEYGLNSRMELRQREIDIENAQFQLIQTKSINEFKGNVQLSVGVMGDNPTLGKVYDNPTKNPRVALSFNIPLYDWGERKARIKAQEAVIQIQELNLNEERRQIIVDIRLVYRNLLNQESQIGIAKQNEKNAQLTYEINLERYANGDLTGMDLNLYQNQLSTKKMSLAQAFINYKIELLNLKIQTLYDFSINRPVIPADLFKQPGE